jgi:hypothetical protein
VRGKRQHSIKIILLRVKGRPDPFFTKADLTPFFLSITTEEGYLQNPQKQAKVKALEEEIDQLVHKLYDLIPEEIKIVEGGNKI